MLSQYIIIAVDESQALGRQDPMMLSEQAIMEIAVAKLKNKKLFTDAHGNFKDIEEWDGIVFDEKSSRIIELQFSEFEETLDGTFTFEYLPCHLKKLEIAEIFSEGLFVARQLPRRLNFIDIGNNFFKGSICIGDFPMTLTDFHADGNHLSGSIVLQDLPPHFENLDLSKNALDGSICLSGLPGTLKSLFLKKNRFSGSICLRNLPQGLKDLDLSKNEFSGEIDFTRLPAALEWIDLSVNSLSGSLQLSNLPKNLEMVKVSHNELSGKLKIDKACSLEELYVTGNKVLGEIDAGTLPPTFKFLDVDSTDVNLHNLENLHEGIKEISFRWSASSAPIAMNKLPATLRKFRANGCKSIEKSDPSEWPRALTNVHLGSCGLNGTFHFEQLHANFVTLDLSANDLEGTIDTHRLPQVMRKLRIEKNRFSGNFDFRGLPQSMEILEISFNDFCGDVDLSAPPMSLKRLCAKRCKLTGDVDMGNLPDSMKFYDLTENNFTSFKNWWYYDLEYVVDCKWTSDTYTRIVL